MMTAGGFGSRVELGRVHRQQCTTATSAEAEVISKDNLALLYKTNARASSVRFQTVKPHCLMVNFSQ